MLSPIAATALLEPIPRRPIHPKAAARFPAAFRALFRRALAMPAGTRAQALQTRLYSKGALAAHRKKLAAFSALGGDCGSQRLDRKKLAAFSALGGMKHRKQKANTFGFFAILKST